jgi:sugar phosphate isomerase/epimerase
MLTYCSNIHPGEGWGDVLANLDSHARAVKAALSPRAAFPLGLRISAEAAFAIDERETARFRDWCAREGFDVATLNGFPHGRFHGAGVKEKVYLPDWRSPARVAYTERLAELLGAFLPLRGAGASGSISTVPIAFRAHWDEADRALVRENLSVALATLARLRDASGHELVLALEPEPGCLLETTAEAVDFLAGLALPDSLAPLLGLCFDCCHQAVEFEEPAEALGALAAAGVRIGKVQVSSALRAVRGEFDALAAFDEPTYLHQVVARDGAGGLARFDDLPAFLGLPPAQRTRFEECRVHFHVPIFAERAEGCGTTRSFLERALPLLPPGTPLEVETYSWNVLPAAARAGSVADSIVRELRWVEANRGGR